MEFNFYSVLVASFCTLIVGFVWYGPLFGKAWMKECNFKEEDLKQTNMFKLFGLTFVFSLILATLIPTIVIHQTGVISMLGGFDKIETAKPSYTAFMADYGDVFRTYKHGALHGLMSGIFFALPIIAINGMFERKSWKYIFIHAGYWMVCLAIMGAIICGWK